MNDDDAIRLWRAIVSEIKAEMGRQDMSSRALARLLDVHPQYVTSRLNGGNPRTGERVILDVRDLAAMARALGLTEVELIERAEHAMDVVRMQTDMTLMSGRLADEAEAETALAEIRGRKRSGRSRG